MNRTVSVWISEENGVLDRFYICSLEDKNPKRYLDLSRGYWFIEGKLHWKKNITFHEDSSRIRTGHALQDMNIIRKLALLS